MQKKENHAKIIFHIDMNAFFCSVACILNPGLRGTAFAIGRENTYKGVLSTASYEARAFGIHAAMPVSEAYRIKPDLNVISIPYKYYQEYHNKFIELIKQYTFKIEVASIDEVYADMTEISKTIHPLVLAKEIQARLMTEHNLPCSIGIAPTLFLAKMASDMKKPLGVTVMRKRDVEEKLYPLSVKEIFGIGKKTYPRLIDNGIKTIGDFMNPANIEKVVNLIGENAYHYVVESVTGHTTDVVDPNRWADNQSISTSSTFDIYLSSISEILYEMRRMTRTVLNKVLEDEMYCKVVTITLRDSDFNTITRQKKLDEFTNDFLIVFDVVTELLESNFDEEKSYRLVGVGLSNLVHKKDLPKDYNLFTFMDVAQKEIIIEDMIKDFKSKYGDKILFRGKKE